MASVWGRTKGGRRGDKLDFNQGHSASVDSDKISLEWTTKTRQATSKRHQVKKTFERKQSYSKIKKWECSQAVPFHYKVVFCGCNLQAWVYAHHQLFNDNIKKLLQHLQKYCPEFLLHGYLLVDWWKYSKSKILKQSSQVKKNSRNTKYFFTYLSIFEHGFH